ncbi:MAG: glycerol-3-phosphate acyltransferase, partial [Lentisphaeria bacterium]|nr:glycerol-3-phosphate acyltransferase [Lentisphaeria bacterium]
LAAGSMPVFAILFTLLHITRASLPEVLLFFLLALLTIVKHSSNIRRLRQGTESRFEKKEKSE